MSNNMHECGYHTGEAKVTIKGFIDGLPFGAIINAKEKTAAFISVRMILPSSSSSRPKKSSSTVSKEDCPGCKSSLTKLLQGGMGWAKALLHIDQVTSQEGHHRKLVCESCPSNCYDFGVCRDDWPNRPAKEQGCGCILSLKVLQGKEACPFGHWEAIS